MAAIAALEEPKLLANGVQLLVEERGRLLARLADMPGVRALPSEANFFLMRVPDAARTFEGLKRQGVLVLVRERNQVAVAQHAFILSLDSPSGGR